MKSKQKRAITFIGRTLNQENIWQQHPLDPHPALPCHSKKGIFISMSLNDDYVFI
ncbi:MULTISPECIES: hypothetical protein [Burkholderia]|uniref:hypothetical protein n=1 Tax=Burkholderia TaxID=32008 RepID=UPI0012D8B9BA|nr:hypothetical protein [Burkholderia cepacia]UIY62673.1 hypothetical protein LZ568_36625 [Burkholderia cepacia]HDR9498651.1 hypothetical protein [Burkholderia cepacia]